MNRAREDSPLSGSSSSGTTPERLPTARKKTNSKEEIDRMIEARMLKMDDVPLGDTPEAKKKRRRLRNCISAQLHRERKRAYVESLEKSVAQLRARVSQLEKENEQLRAQRVVVEESESKEAVTSSQDGFEDGVVQSFEDFPSSLFDDIVAAADDEFHGEADFPADALFEGINLDGSGRKTKKRRRKQHTGSVFGVITVAVLCLIGASSFMRDGNSMETLSMPQAQRRGRRARHMLSVSENVTRAAEENAAGAESSQALALWSDILNLHENQSVVQKRVNLGALFHRLEVMKPAAKTTSQKQLRGTNRALVPWTSGEKNSVDDALRSLSMLSRGVFSEVKVPSSAKHSANSSIILCPRVYGSYNRTATPEDNDEARNRKLMLVLPSSALDGANYKDNQRAWDGKWVEIDAVVTAVRPLMIKQPAAAPQVTAPSA